MTPIPAVSIAAFRGPNILLVKRSKPPYAGLWSLPGGVIQLGETAREAAARELREETGLVADDLFVNGIHDVIEKRQAVVDAHYVLIIFLAHNLSGIAAAGDDARDIRWFAPSDLAQATLTPGLENILAKLAPIGDERR